VRFSIDRSQRILVLGVFCTSSQISPDVNCEVTRRAPKIKAAFCPSSHGMAILKNRERRFDVVWMVGIRRRNAIISIGKAIVSPNENGSFPSTN
jgi:hypothetical protein